MLRFRLIGAARCAANTPDFAGILQRLDTSPVSVEGLRVTDARDGQGLELEDLPSVQSMGYSVSVVRQLGRRQGQGQARSRFRELDLLQFELP